MIYGKDSEYEKTFLKRIEPIDRRIKSFADYSKTAPSEFLDSELRRHFNLLMMEYPTYRFTDNYFSRVKEQLETEYMCYFEQAKASKRIKPNKDWQRIYAGTDPDIETYLRSEGLESVLSRLGFKNQMLRLNAGDEFTLFEKVRNFFKDIFVGYYFSNPRRPIKEIRKWKVPKKIGKYLVGTGMLYPKKDSLAVHPNMLYAQVMDQMYSMDSPFLQRDLMRLACDESRGGNPDGDLTHSDMWGYWKDILALNMGNLPEIKPRYQESLRIGMVNSKLKYYFERGRKFVPQRYVELEPEIEKFDWVFVENP